MEITKGQKDAALEKARQMAVDADETKVDDALGKVDGYKGRKGIAKVWDKVRLLAAVIKSPYLMKPALFAAIGAIIYLVSPVDVIPDVLPVIGLLDDVAVIISIFGAVAEAIKREPEKALKIVDSLPEGLKKIGARAFGVAGGIAVGAKVGAMTGDALGEFMSDHDLAPIYEALVKEKEGLKSEGLGLKGKLAALAEHYVSLLIEKYIRTAFEKKYRRSLEILVCYLFSVLLLLSPPLGKEVSLWASAVLLALAFAMAIYSTVRGALHAWPYVAASIRKHSIYRGVMEVLGKNYRSVGKSEQILNALDFELSDKELLRLAKLFLKAFAKQVVALILGLGLISLAFFTLRHAILLQSVGLSNWQIITYPFQLLLA